MGRPFLHRRRCRCSRVRRRLAHGCGEPSRRSCGCRSGCGVLNKGCDSTRTSAIVIAIAISNGHNEDAKAVTEWSGHSISR